MDTPVPIPTGAYHSMPIAYTLTTLSVTSQ